MSSEATNSYTKTVKCAHGTVPLTAVVVGSRCAHCGGEIRPGTLAAAIGQPHHILTHWNCWPYFNFDDIYKHGRNLGSFPRS
jgi:hypothetical protein